MILKRLLYWSVVFPLLMVTLLAATLLPATPVLAATFALYPSTTHTAYINVDQASQGTTQTEYSAAQYTDVGISDNNYVTALEATIEGTYTGQHYTFDLSAYNFDYITEIKYTWEGGYGIIAGGTNWNTNPSIFYEKSDAWQADQAITTADATYTKTFNTDFTDLVDANTVFHFEVEGKGVGDGEGTIDADFVKLEVTYASPPDNQIRNQGEVVEAYIGDNIYNTFGTSQTKSQTVNNWVIATYEIKVENDGSSSDNITVTGTARSGGWRISYHDALTGGSDITADVTGAGWSIVELASLASTEIRVEITPDGTILPGAYTEVLVTLTSTTNAMQDVVKATITTAPPVGGSGGGGGGGSVVVEPPSVGVSYEGTVSHIEINSQGQLLAPLDVTAADGSFAFKLDSSTTVLTDEGKVPETIDVRKVALPISLPANTKIVSDVYQIFPPGLTFDPPAALTLGYDPAELPENISSLNMKYYTPEEGWVNMESESGSVAGMGTLTSAIAHLSTFAILAQSSITLAASDLLIVPTEVDIGETVNIIILVTNADSQSGSAETTLKINGLVEESKKVTLAAGGSKLVSFSIITHTAGTYSLEVNGLTSSFTVKERPEAPPTGAPPTGAPPAEAPPTGAPPTEAPPINWLLLGGIIAGLIVVISLIISVVERQVLRIPR